jgi:hypothetical protein
MTGSTIISAEFRDLDRAAETLEQLRGLGISDQDITVHSSLPYSHKALGRPEVKTKLPLVSIGSAVAGLLVGLFLTVVVPRLYVIRVGNQPISPVPTTALLVYELIMLVLVLGTFVGIGVLTQIPAAGPEYDGPPLSDDRIGLLFNCPADKVKEARWVLEVQEAKNVHEPKRREQ